MAHNVLLMRSRGSLIAAIWRSPNDRQGVKRISFVMCRLFAMVTTHFAEAMDGVGNNYKKFSIIV